MAGRVARTYEWIAVVLVLLLYLPILFIFSGRLSLAALIELLQTARYYNMLSFTLLQASLSTFASIVLAIPLAYIISHYRFFGRNFIRMLALIPFVLPSIFLVLGVVLVWGNNGVVNQLLAYFYAEAASPILGVLYNLAGIILAHTLYNFGICTRLVAQRWQSLPLSQLQAARTLGATRWHIWRDVVLPWLTPALMTSASIIFLLCFTSFAVILVLGGGPWYSSLEVAIYRLVKIEFDISSAAQLAFIQLCITLGISCLYLFSKRRIYTQEIRSVDTLPQLLKSKQYWAVIYVCIILAFVLSPIFAVFLLSFRVSSSRSRSSLDIRAYKELYTLGIKPLYTSVILSLSAMLLALFGGGYITVALNKLRSKTARIMEIFLLIPYCISPIVLALGYSSLSQWLGVRSLVVLFLVHAVLAIPLVVRILLLSRRSIADDVINAAKTLGANTRNIRFTIYLPLLMPAILVSISLAITLSLGELSAALMLLPANRPSIPVAMYQLIGHYRFFDASRFGVLLILLTALMLILTEKVGALFHRGKKHVTLL